ncbi:MAG: LLM class flavin-dependent oxidoreductase, partial [Hyphomicrobiaceae bacterium]
LRETVDIIRKAFRGERLIYDGRKYQLPLPGGEGKPLRLDHEPADIPIYLATLAPRSLAYTGRAADGWLGTSFSPDHAEAHLAHIRAGAESVGRTLADIDLIVSCTLAIGDDVDAMINARRRAVAFNLGAMGSATTNFYNDAFKRAGFVEDAEAVQSLWLAGKRDDAAARVPDALVTQFGAIGTPEMVAARLRVYRDAGVNGLQLRFDTPDLRKRLDFIGQVMDRLPDQSLIT